MTPPVPAPQHDDATYKIVRFYFNTYHEDHGKVITTGLSLDEAQAHCNDPFTRSEGEWFDGYTEET